MIKRLKSIWVIPILMCFNIGIVKSKPLISEFGMSVKGYQTSSKKLCSETSVYYGAGLFISKALLKESLYITSGINYNPGKACGSNTLKSFYIPIELRYALLKNLIIVGLGIEYRFVSNSNECFLILNEDRIPAERNCFGYNLNLSSKFKIGSNYFIQGTIFYGTNFTDSFKTKSGQLIDITNTGIDLSFGYYLK